MKYIFLSLSILIASCNGGPTPAAPKKEETPVVDSPVYHIKVFSYLGDGYCIHFTNDNWKTFDDIYETFDITMGQQPVAVRWQTKIFNSNNSCEEAAAFARQFKTYQSCIDNNTSTYNEANRLKQYYLLHPPSANKKPSCDISTNIY